jgi:hypothetical protein
MSSTVAMRITLTISLPVQNKDNDYPQYLL